MLFTPNENQIATLKTQEWCKKLTFGLRNKKTIKAANRLMRRKLLHEIDWYANGKSNADSLGFICFEFLTDVQRIQRLDDSGLLSQCLETHKNRLLEKGWRVTNVTW